MRWVGGHDQQLLEETATGKGPGDKSRRDRTGGAPQAFRGELLPELLPGAPQTKREGPAGGGQGGLCERRVDPQVDHLVSELGIRMSKDRVSRICRELDEQVEAFRVRPLEGAHPTCALTPST